MKKVFIVHGFNGTPNGGWKSWLMDELAKNGIYACALPMPSPDKPIKSEWIKVINNAVQNPTKEIFLVGHSLGVPAILRYIESLSEESKIGGAILVSGPINLIKRNGYENVNKFIEDSFDFEKIKRICENFIIIHGEIDKWVPFSDAKHLAKKLSSDLVPISGGGHLSPDEKCFQLPQALEALLKMMK